MWIVLSMFSVVSLLTAQRGVARPDCARGGDLDLGFGVSGKAIGPRTPYNRATALVVQRGKLVAAGYSAEAGGDFGLARCNADGRLDTGFGGGKVITDCLPDGKLMAAGFTTFYGSMDFALARYLTS